MPQLLSPRESLRSTAREATAKGSSHVAMKIQRCWRLIMYFKNTLNKNARLKFLIFQCIIIFFFFFNYEYRNSELSSFSSHSKYSKVFAFNDLNRCSWLDSIHKVCPLLTLHFAFSFSTNEIKLPMHILLVSNKCSLISSQELMIFNKCGKKWKALW